MGLVAKPVPVFGLYSCDEDNRICSVDELTKDLLLSVHLDISVSPFETIAFFCNRILLLKP